MNGHNLNKNSLSKACDIPYTTNDNWYKRGYEGLKLPTLKKLADFFGTTLDYWSNDEIEPLQLKQKELLNCFNQLSDRFQDYIIVTIKELITAQDSSKEGN